MRVAWFSPLPPSTSGIAAYTAEVTPLLAPHFRVIDLYCDRVRAGADGGEWLRAGAVRPASEFVYRHRRQPYDLIVYQLGNSSAHDYMWAYAFRYPGLLVLHDAQLHQARALQLLRRLEPRLDDYWPRSVPAIPTRRPTSATCSPPGWADRSSASGRTSRCSSPRRG